MLHGEAVAMGMVAEARLAEQLGIAPAGTSAAIKDACSAAGLPVRLPKMAVERLLEFARTDKKARGGVVHYSLPSKIGEMFGADRGWSVPVADAAVRAALA